jgi:hypothetical protein
MGDGEGHDAVRRFEQSMIMDFDSWHDGTGYDLDAVASATPDERQRITDLLLARDVTDWRDVEALAALGTPEADERLKRAFHRGSLSLRLSVLRHAPHVVSERQRTKVLVEGIERSTIGDGLTPTLLDVEEFHPPAIVKALLRGTLKRPGDVAVNLAGMVAFVHGAAKEAFDWNQRPLFLRFNTDDDAERAAAFRDLCALCGIDPAPYL